MPLLSVTRTLQTIACLWVGCLLGCSPSLPEYPEVMAEGEFIRIPLPEIADGGVHFFTFKHAGTNVNFLVRTDGKGALHTHFDACYSCYRYKRGFIVEDDALVCIACRLAYRLEEENWDFIGACAPIPFHFAVDGESVVIKRSVLEKGSRFFS